MTKYEIRQQVRTVPRSWLEVIAEGPFERPLRNEFERLVRENPNEYFELVEVTASETCLKHTGTTGVILGDPNKPGNLTDEWG